MWVELWVSAAGGAVFAVCVMAAGDLWLEMSNHSVELTLECLCPYQTHTVGTHHHHAVFCGYQYAFNLFSLLTSVYTVG